MFLLGVVVGFGALFAVTLALEGIAYLVKWAVLRVWWLT